MSGNFPKFRHGNVDLALCYGDCKKKPHYHCPYDDCDYSTFSNLVIKKHLDKHFLLGDCNYQQYNRNIRNKNDPPDGTEQLLAILAESGAPVNNSDSLSSENDECQDSKDDGNDEESYFNPKTSFSYSKFSTITHETSYLADNKLNTSLSKPAKRDYENISEQHNTISKSGPDKPYLGKNNAYFESLLSHPFCYLCCDNLQYTRKGLFRHFHLYHLSNYVKHAGVMSIKCHLNCSQFEDGHFHCPERSCETVLETKEITEEHILYSHIQTIKPEPLDYDEESSLMEDHKTIVIGNQAESPQQIIEEKIGPTTMLSEEIIGDSTTEIISIEHQQSALMDICDIELTEQTLGGCSAEIVYNGECDSKQGIRESLVDEKRRLSTDESLVNFIDMLEGEPHKPSLAKKKEHLISKLKPPKCFLCADFNFHNVSMERLLKHFVKCHLNHSVRFPHIISVICKLNCDGLNQGHYHCPKPGCETYLHKKDRLVAHHLKHYEICREKKKPSVPRGAKPPKQYPKPVKTFDFHGMSFERDLSIMDSPEQMVDYLCLPFCYLCTPSPTFCHMSRLERHFTAFHLNRAIDLGNCYTVICQRGCSPRGPTVAHYHCPLCSKIIDSKISFWVHIESHTREESYIAFKGESASVIASHLPVPIPTYDITYMGLPVLKQPSVTDNTAASLQATQLPYCYLCDNGKNFIIDRRLKLHFTRCHINPSITFDTLHVLACKKNCNSRVGKAAHYHCLFCEFAFPKKFLVTSHMKNKHLKGEKSDNPNYAEHYVPQITEDHSVPEEWIPLQERSKVRRWEKLFNEEVLHDRCFRARKKFIITEKMKHLIDGHVRRNLKLSDHRLRNWVRFRGAKVIDCPQLNLHNLLVIQHRRYDVNTHNNALQAIEDPLKGGFELKLESENPMEEFLQYYRIIPTFEQLFKIFYEIHLMNGYHLGPVEMNKQIRQKYAYVTSSILEMFLMMCPECGPNMRSTSAPLTVTLENSDNHNLAGLQLILVDVCDNPDGMFNYVIECRDRCSGFSWIFPSVNALPAQVGEIILRGVFSYTGLPKFLITNCGAEFLKGFLSYVESTWISNCKKFISNSLEANSSIELLSADPFVSSLHDLVTENPLSWAQQLPMFQYRLNHNRDSMTHHGPSAFQRLCHGRATGSLNPPQTRTSEPQPMEVEETYEEATVRSDEEDSKEEMVIVNSEVIGKSVFSLGKTALL